ncbi:MAG: hypothetical protein MK212_02045 [Saprospiraceae bacterium]|nr:hypothetical protein [Saprospiraceae bacterium]
MAYRRNIVTIILILGVIIWFLPINEQYCPESRYLVEGIDIRVVDWIEYDSNGCGQIANYDINRENIYAGFGLFMNKKFVIDSNDCYNYNFNKGYRGVAKKGYNGSLDSLVSFDIYFNARNSITQNHLFQGVDSMSFLSEILQHPKHKGSYPAKQMNSNESSSPNNITYCLDNPYYPTIDSFINTYNSKVSAYTFSNELFFWVEKEKLKEVDTLVLNISFMRDNISTKQDFIIEIILDSQ